MVARTPHCLLLAFVVAVVPASAAFAYRPFDSTDASVAEQGKTEVELSPASFIHDDDGDAWVAPQLRLNYGFAQHWEIVLEGQGEHRRASQSTLVENALSLKYVAKEGSLQDKPGPSIATEVSLLLPDVHDQRGTGFEFTGIVGQKWSWGAVHLNAAAALSRNHRGEFFLGAILEGPEAWSVRPVAEIVYEREFGMGEEVAALAGVIWQVKDTLAFDVAVRHAMVNGSPATELRLGVTFAFSAR